jgi:hypothetical protein
VTAPENSRTAVKVAGSVRALPSAARQRSELAAKQPRAAAARPMVRAAAGAAGGARAAERDGTAVE